MSLQTRKNSHPGGNRMTPAPFSHCEGGDAPPDLRLAQASLPPSYPPLLMRTQADRLDRPPFFVTGSRPSADTLRSARLDLHQDVGAAAQRRSGARTDHGARIADGGQVDVSPRESDLRQGAGDALGPATGKGEIDL